MEITEGQLMILLQTTLETLRIGDGGRVFTFTEETRRAVVDAVFKTQTGVLAVRKPDDASL